MSSSPSSKSPATKSPSSRSPSSKSPATKSPASRSPASRSPASRSPASRSPSLRSFASRSSASSEHTSYAENAFRDFFGDKLGLYEIANIYGLNSPQYQEYRLIIRLLVDILYSESLEEFNGLLSRIDLNGYIPYTEYIGEPGYPKKYGPVLLALAVEENLDNIVTYLLELGVSPKEESGYNEVPLLIAIGNFSRYAFDDVDELDEFYYENMVSIIYKLIEYGAIVSQEVIDIAVANKWPREEIDKWIILGGRENNWQAKKHILNLYESTLRAMNEADRLRTRAVDSSPMQAHPVENYLLDEWVLRDICSNINGDPIQRRGGKTHKKKIAKRKTNKKRKVNEKTKKQ